MVFRTKRGEIGSPPRGPCLLQGSRRRPAHNPRRHLLRSWLYDPRLDVLGERGREPDAVCGWILWGEEIDVERFAMQTTQIRSARTIKRLSKVGIGVHVCKVRRSLPRTLPVTQSSSGATVKRSITL